MILTKPDIRRILDAIGREVMVPTSTGFNFEISRRGQGYHSDPEVRKLQTKLSIMLEMAEA